MARWESMVPSREITVRNEIREEEEAEEDEEEEQREEEEGEDEAFNK